MLALAFGIPMSIILVEAGIIGIIGERAAHIYFTLFNIGKNIFYAMLTVVALISYNKLGAKYIMMVGLIGAATLAMVLVTSISSTVAKTINPALVYDGYVIGLFRLTTSINYFGQILVPLFLLIAIKSWKEKNNMKE